MQQINTNLDTSVPSARTQYALFLERALAFAIDYFPFPMLGLFTLITLYKKGYNFTLAQDALCILGFLFLFIIDLAFLINLSISFPLLNNILELANIWAV